MHKHSFFTKNIGKIAQKLTLHGAQKASKNAANWIRPPYAIDELDFLLSCDRCGDCIEACPHGVIMSLSVKSGIGAYKTPVMDLLNHACHLCSAWPCVTACETGALALPKEQRTAERFLPKIAKMVINKDTCIPFSGPDCGACSICPVDGAMNWVKGVPVINEDLCTGCAMCREACIIEPKGLLVESKYK